MANAIFTTKVNPTYDDLPEVRYHFPRTYLNQAQQAVGDWIIYYEPRREGADLSGRAGRQSYFATAKVTRIEPDLARDDHYYAYVSDYLEFTETVAFRTDDFYPESMLRKNDGSTNKGAFGRAVRLVPFSEYTKIVELGLAPVISAAEKKTELMQVAEVDIEYGIERKKVAAQRIVRDAAFAKSIQTTYQYTCAMTGLKLINGGGHCEIEAAHIKPVEKEGPDSPRNGIALSRTIHWMFDRRIISMEDDGKLLLAKKLIPEPILQMLNRDGYAQLPQNSVNRPHPIFLKYHRDRFKGE